jgi:23S rRNA (adenine2503-C2)-methyltransferase
MKTQLFGMTRDELRDLAVGHDQAAFAGDQLAEWIYRRRIADFDSMSNLQKSFRQELSEGFITGLLAPEQASESSDGTKKYLYRAGSRFVEAAYIPEAHRNTLCLSTQVGCKMGCLFCMTGKQGFQENLEAGSIVNQLASLPEFDAVSNIVYMGMGEPFDNLEAVLRSLTILTAEWGFGLSPKRITVSTIGVLPAIRRFLAESEAHLAISLHSPFADERKRLMPIENVHPAHQVIELLKEADVAKRRRISFEYIMFDGVNDTPRHARELVRMLHGLNARINLIHFHPIPGTPLEASPEEQMESFRDRLKESGITATIRKSRGQDIQAACGLLSTKALLAPGPVDY